MKTKHSQNKPQITALLFSKLWHMTHNYFNSTPADKTGLDQHELLIDPSWIILTISVHFVQFAHCWKWFFSGFWGSQIATYTGGEHLRWSFQLRWHNSVSVWLTSSVWCTAEMFRPCHKELRSLTLCSFRRKVSVCLDVRHRSTSTEPTISSRGSSRYDSWEIKSGDATRSSMTLLLDQQDSVPVQ